jgi:hypothetical protein
MGPRHQQQTESRFSGSNWTHDGRYATYWTQFFSLSFLHFSFPFWCNQREKLHIEKMLKECHRNSIESTFVSVSICSYQNLVFTFFFGFFFGA